LPALIRKTILQIETTLMEGGRAAAEPLRMIAAMAVIKNPWSGRAFVEKPQAGNPRRRSRPRRIADRHDRGGSRLRRSCRRLRQGGRCRPRRGDRTRLGADPHASFRQPLSRSRRCQDLSRLHQHARPRQRADHDPAHGQERRGPAFALSDDPDLHSRCSAADEIVVALGASIGGRPHHRIGNRYEDLKELGRDVGNPASV
jgi:hypothetical protein